MRVASSLLLITLAASLAASNATRADDRAREYLKYLPADINALSIVRIDDIMKTPMAVREDWKAKQEARFMAGSMRVPPWVQLWVRGQRLASGGAGPTMAASIVPEPQDIPFDKLSPFPQDRSTMDEIGGVKVLRSGRGILAEIAPGVIGAMAPADRLAFGGWMRTIHTDSAIRIPKYLSDVAQSYKPQILMAVDVRDLLDPRAMSHRVDTSAPLQGKTDVQKAMKGLLSRLKGIRVGVNIEDDIFAAIAFDFDGQTIPEAKYLQPMLSELLDDAGAHLDDVATAKTKILESSVEISGKISDVTLRRLMTLIVTPVVMQKEEYMPLPPKPAPSEAEATQKYFSMVNNTVHDLQILNHRAKDYYRTAQWHDNYANKIAGFPTTGVDPEVVKYGQYIVHGLRALAASLRGVQIKLDRLENDISYSIHVSDWSGPGGTWTAWGYNPAPWEVSDNLQQVRNAQDDAAQAGDDDRDKIWTAMGNERDSVQGRMSAKYHTKFSL